MIIVFCLLATYVVYFKLSASNTYIASEVIHYNDEQAEKGLAPTGEKLDVNEIQLIFELTVNFASRNLTFIFFNL